MNNQNNNKSNRHYIPKKSDSHRGETSFSGKPMNFHNKKTEFNTKLSNNNYSHSSSSNYNNRTNNFNKDVNRDYKNNFSNNRQHNRGNINNKPNTQTNSNNNANNKQHNSRNNNNNNRNYNNRPNNFNNNNVNNRQNNSRNYNNKPNNKFGNFNKNRTFRPLSAATHTNKLKTNRNVNTRFNTKNFTKANKFKSNIKKPSTSKYNKNKSKTNLYKSKNKNNSRDKNKKFVKKKPATFIYRIDYADPQRKRAKTSLSRELFLVKTKLLKFYNNIKKDQIRRYANTKTFKIKFKVARGYTNKALLKYSSSNSLKKRLALNAFFSLVEHRLDVLLFRSNLVTTMSQARQVINHRHIYVNEQMVTHAGFMLKNFDIISLSNPLYEQNRRKLISNIKLRKVTLYPPKYIYVDYRLMRATLLANPLVKQVPFPFKIDLRKWLGLAKYMF